MNECYANTLFYYSKLKHFFVFVAFIIVYAATTQNSEICCYWSMITRSLAY